MTNEKNWSLLLLLFRFHIRFSFFFVPFFHLFAIVSSVITTLDKFQFQSQVRVFQINIVVPIRLKLKFYAVFIKGGSIIIFLFLGGQDIVNYWAFPSKISRTATKSWYRKLFDMNNEMFVKMSLRDQLAWFADFVGMTLLAVLFLLPLPGCFLKVCLPTLPAAVLNFFHH